MHSKGDRSTVGSLWDGLESTLEPMDWAQVGLGVGGLAAVTVAGAGLGAVVNKPCTSQDSLAEAVVCGPRMGAAMYGSAALVLGGVVGGLLVAALSKNYRTAGFTAAATSGGVIVAGLLASKSQTA